MTEVVPKYFTMKKYESFQRQINGWGFKILNQSGNDKGAYYHEYFLRGMPHLLVLIQRVPPNKKVKVLKYKSTEDEEPNFLHGPTSTFIHADIVILSQQERPGVFARGSQYHSTSLWQQAQICLALRYKPTSVT
jgi:hypothetical protein